MIQHWRYDIRNSHNQPSGKGWITNGNLFLKGATASSFSTPMGEAPLDSDFLPFQLAALLARGVGSFNADMVIKNRGMKVNADFFLAPVDAAKIKTMLNESGSFQAGLAKLLTPGCQVYTIKLTGLIGALFPSNIYAAFSNEATPALLGYWSTNPQDREGLWFNP